MKMVMDQSVSKGYSNRDGNLAYVAHNRIEWLYDITIMHMLNGIL